MLDAPQIAPEQLASLGEAELRALATQLLARIEHHNHEIDWRDAKLEKLAYEIAHLRRMKFSASNEQLNAQQRALFDESVDADIAALEAELEKLKKPAPADKKQSAPKRAALPQDLPHVEISHEPDSTTCACGCALQRVGEDVSQKLDYTPGVFTVQNHVRGKWACRGCRTLTQAPVPAEIIDKGMPTAGLLAHVLVAKHSDHLPLYRQEAIFARAGLAIPRSTLAAWVGVCGVRLQPLVDALKRHVLACPVVHADETPVAMLAPGKGKTHRAYLWAYAAGAFEPLRAVVYDFTISRAGEHARNFLGDWKGSLVCDDYGGYKALWERGVTEAGCMAHARRYFVDLVKTDKSVIAAKAGGVHRSVVRHRARGAGHDARPATRTTPTARPAGHAGIARLAHGAAHEGRGRRRHCQGHRLQLEALGCIDALSGRSGTAHRQQPRRAADQDLGNDLSIVPHFVK